MNPARQSRVTRSSSKAAASLKADAGTQTLSVENLVRQVLISKVADGLQDQGLQLIACTHTRELQLSDITNDIINKHSETCAKQHQQRRTQGVPLKGDWLRLMFEPPRRKLKGVQTGKKTVKIETVTGDKAVEIETVKEVVDDKHCHICGKSFRYPALLKYHIKAHMEENSFKCNQCDYAAKDKSLLRKHVLFVHTKKYPYYCKFCSKGCSSIDDLGTHEGTHLQDDYPYKCQHCEKVFAKEKNMKNHYGVHDKSKRIKCDLCRKSFVFWSVFVDHLKRNHGAVRRRHHMLCLRCDVEYDVWPELLKHMREKHDGEPFEKKVKVMCYFCPATYTSKQRRIIHLKTCHNVLCSDKDNQCLECDLKFDYVDLVLNHMKEHHKECLRPPPHVLARRKKPTLEARKGGFVVHATKRGLMREANQQRLRNKRLKLNQEPKSTDDIRKCILSQKCWLCEQQCESYADVLNHVKSAHPNCDTSQMTGVEPSNSAPIGEQFVHSASAQKDQTSDQSPAKETDHASSQSSQMPSISIAVSKDNIENFKKSVQDKQCWMCGKEITELRAFLKHLSEEHKLTPSQVVQKDRPSSGTTMSQSSQKGVTMSQSPQKGPSTSQFAPKEQTTDPSSIQKDQSTSDVAHENDQTSNRSSPEIEQVVSQLAPENDQAADQSAPENNQTDRQSEPHQNVHAMGESSAQKSFLQECQAQKDPATIQSPPRPIIKMQSPCDFCPVMLETSKMNQHLKDVHGALNSKDCKKCLVCKLEFRDWSRLVKHIKNIHKEHSARQARKPEAVNRCWLCQAQINQATKLVDHMKQYHNLILQVQTL